MTDEAQTLIEETIVKYSEYLQEDIDSSTFLINVFASQLAEVRKENLALRKILNALARKLGE